MIFSSLNQVNCFLLFLFRGIILGFISQIFFTLTLKKYQKIYLKIIFETLFYTFFSVFFCFLINFFNFGQYSFALILAYILGYIWIKNIDKNLFVFLETKWYNTINKCITHLRSKHKDRHGRKQKKS